MDYETIKTLAKALGCRVTDLIALAQQNDPFYAGTATDWRQAEWFAEVWRQAGYSGGVHLRRVHYWCVSRAPRTHTGEPYENTQKCWQYLTQASKMARYLKLVNIADIADHKSPPPVINAAYNWWDDSLSVEVETEELTEPYVRISGLSNAKAQPYHLEIWCEKSTMNDVLEPLCQRYNANLATFEGEVSITACYQLVERVRASGGKPARIFYISDFDPAGNSMPVATARKIEYLLKNSQGAYDVRLKPIVLTSDQVQQYKLPRTPIKESEKRAANFEAWAGAGAVELDALEAIHPGQLAAIVQAEIRPYYSESAAALIREQRDALRQAISDQVQEITSRYEAEIEALAAMQDELRGITVDTSHYEVDRFTPHVLEDNEEWLFDSQRDYVEQITFYKSHKGQSSAHAQLA